MRYYFAGAYARRAELRAYADRLHGARIGATVVSRWIQQDQSEADAGFSAENLGSQAATAAAWAYGRRDLEDLSICQTIVSFTGFGDRGGRHIEHGVAISYRDNHPWDLPQRTEPIRLVIVGPREHVFHCHPATEVFADFDAFLKHEIEAA
jgi:hypothetical protein